MSKQVLIAIGIIGLLALMIHYFLSYDQPIRYGGGNIDPNNEEVIMDDMSHEKSMIRNILEKSNITLENKTRVFDIEAVVERLEKEYADEME